MLQRHHYFADEPSSLVRGVPEGRMLPEICILEWVLNSWSRLEEVWEESSSLDLSLDLGGISPLRLT